MKQKDFDFNAFTNSAVRDIWDLANKYSEKNINRQYEIILELIGGVCTIIIEKTLYCSKPGVDPVKMVDAWFVLVRNVVDRLRTQVGEPLTPEEFAAIKPEEERTSE